MDAMQKRDDGESGVRRCLAGDGASGTQVQAQAQARTLGGRGQLISRQGVRASGRVRAKVCRSRLEGCGTSGGSRRGGRKATGPR